MPNYNNSKIYKLVCYETGKCYVGSTTENILSRRLTGHVCAYRRWKKGLRGYVTSFEVLEGGNYKIKLIQNCNCENKDELEEFERHYIENIDCVNKQIPGGILHKQTCS